MLGAGVKLTEEEVAILAKRSKFRAKKEKWTLTISRFRNLTIAALYIDGTCDPIAIGYAMKNPIDKENTLHAQRQATRRAFDFAHDMERYFR